MNKTSLNKEEKRLLLIIRYFPLLLILTISIIATVYSSSQLIKHDQKEIKYAIENYTTINNVNIKDSVTNIYKYVSFEKKNSLIELKKELKDKVYQAHNIATTIYNANKDTKNKQEIIDIIKYTLGSYLSKEGKNYFFIDDITGTKILDPINKDLEGENLLEFSDAKGYKFVKTITNTIKERSEQFDQYYWYKDNNKTKHYKKISFYKYFEPFEFAIGSGEYIDDFENNIKNHIISYIKDINKTKKYPIYILNNQKKLLLHKNEQLINRQVVDLMPNSNIDELINKVKEKDTYISYDFLIKKDVYHKRTSFLKNFEEWEWIIGSGYDNYDLSQKILKKKLMIEDVAQEQFISILIASIILTIILMALSLYVTKILEKKFISFKLNLKKEEEDKEKESKKAARLYKDIFESNKSIILLINPTNGDIISANKSACDFYGYDRNKLLSLNISDINILSKEEVQEEMENAIKKDRGYFNFIHKLANGEKRNVRVTSSVSDYLNMSVLFSTITDVTKDFQVQEKLLETENNFKSLFEFSNIGLGIRDINGNFVKVNKKLLEMLNYDEKSLLNKNCSWISTHDKVDEEIQFFKDLINKKIKDYNIEKSFIRKDGTTFDGILTMASILDENEDITYILSSIIDITEKKRKDNLLFQQSKMAAMGEMIGNIAHQWKQPLNLISMSNGVIKLNREMEDINSEEEINEAITNIDNGIKYLASTVDDFKNFFKPNKEISSFKIDNIIEKTEMLSSSQFKSKGITIIKDLCSTEVESFENELIQVLINILNNSKDAFENKNQEKYIFIKTYKEDTKLIIKIKDNAGGIPSKIINNIFEPYFTTKHKSKGTGIGLYMSQEIITKHMNGNIFVENIKYKYEDIDYTGAQFTIELYL